MVEISNTELRTFNLTIHHLQLVSAITDDLSGRLLHFPPTQRSCQTVSEISDTLLCTGLNTKAMECRSDGFTPLKTFERRATRLLQISGFQDKKKKEKRPVISSETEGETQSECSFMSGNEAAIVKWCKINKPEHFAFLVR